MIERLVDIESVVDLSDIIDALQELPTEELMAHGLSATNTWDEIDDPVLIGPDGCRSRRGRRATRTTNGCSATTTR